MTEKQQLVAELGLEHFSDAEQQEIFERYTYAVGAAIGDGLSDEQRGEFEEIIDGNQTVIENWLSAHAPEYRDDPVYKEFQIGYDEDPEKVPADKVYASIGWIRVNRPDYEQIVERIKDEFRQALAATA